MLLNDYTIKLYKLIIKEISLLFPSIVNFNFKKDKPIKVISGINNFGNKTHTTEINKIINIILALENLNDVKGDKEYFFLF